MQTRFCSFTDDSFPAIFHHEPDDVFTSLLLVMKIHSPPNDAEFVEGLEKIQQIPGPVYGISVMDKRTISAIRSAIASEALFYTRG